MREVEAGNGVASENEITKRREMLYHRLCGVSACVNGPPQVAPHVHVRHYPDRALIPRVRRAEALRERIVARVIGR
jgi:hypothetical protein